MEIALFDTSVWINYSNGKVNNATNLLDSYLRDHFDEIMVTPTVIQEFLMGVKTVNGFREYNIHFSRLNLCNDDWQYTSVMAARLYFDFRKKGITIRKSTDCLIAQIAIQNDVLLVHNDSDFELIAKGSELRIFK